MDREQHIDFIEKDAKERSEVITSDITFFGAIYQLSVKKAGALRSKKVNYSAAETVLNGYMLTLHGSLHTDMDLIAVPWVHSVSPIEELVKAINDCLGDTVWKENNLTTGEEKPHGRITYTLSIGSDWFVDLSIIKPNLVSPKLVNAHIRSDFELPNI